MILTAIIFIIGLLMIAIGILAIIGGGCNTPPTPKPRKLKKKIISRKDFWNYAWS